MCGQSLIPKGTLEVKISLDKEGFPLLFNDIKPLFKSKARWDVVRGLTFATISRAIKRFEDEYLPINYDSITKPSWAQIRTLNDNVIKNLIIQMKIRRIKIEDIGPKDYKLFSSGAPDGSSSKTALQTLSRMSLATIEKIAFLTGKVGRSHIINCALKISGSFFQNLVDPVFFAGKRLMVKGDEQMDSIFMDIDTTPRNDLRTRRLAAVEDPELKIRIVAMFDHFSQLFLRKLSNRIFDILKMIPSDRTFTQEPRFNHEGFVQNDDPYYSLDLTAATDRFPIEFQLQILNHLGLSTQQVDAWKYVMVGLPFNKIDEDDDFIKYEVGQPMGARSSWPVFTLCHHLLVRYCAWQVGIKDFHNYIILGDDIVIKNTSVAKYYMKLMGILGVEISETKTHISKDHYEFAKRWFRQDEEISPIPIRGICDNISNLGTIFQILYEISVTRGLVYFPGVFLTGFGKFYSEVSEQTFSKVELKTLKRYKIKDPFRGLKYITTNRILVLTRSFDFFLKYKGQALTYDDLRTYIVQVYGNRNFDIPIPYDKNLLKELFNNEFFLIMRDLYKEKINQYQKLRELNLIKYQSLISLGYGHHLNDIDIIGKGYLTLIENLKESLKDLLSYKDKNLVNCLNSILSFDNDLITNREGSSNTKRMNNFNRFIRKIEKHLKSRSEVNFDFNIFSTFNQRVDVNNMFADPRFIGNNEFKILTDNRPMYK
jgi:hypothetical protein